MQTSQNALFIGRFQPPHKGHEAAIKSILNSHKRLLIAIGSSNKSRTKENPLSAKERLFLLKKMLPAKNKKISFAFVPDSPSDKKWVRFMLANFPPEKYDIYSKNPLVKKLLKNRYRFHNLKFRNRSRLQGSKIRKLLRRGMKTNSIPKKIKKIFCKKYEKIIKSCA